MVVQIKMTDSTRMKTILKTEKRYLKWYIKMMEGIVVKSTNNSGSAVLFSWKEFVRKLRELVWKHSDDLPNQEKYQSFTVYWYIGATYSRDSVLCGFYGCTLSQPIAINKKQKLLSWYPSSSRVPPPVFNSLPEASNDCLYPGL